MQRANTSPSLLSSGLALERLTALWALNEAGLGGMLHAFRVPFVGLTVGGIAIILISLIAHSAKNKYAAVIKATLIVLIIKAAVSPHSPPGAYIAVAFQGFLGAALFSLIPNFRLAAMLFAVVALLETACQRLITMTLLFGKSIWEAIDAFAMQAFHALGVQLADDALAASWWLVGLYLGIYLLGAVLIGWWAGRMPAAIEAVPVDGLDQQWQSAGLTPAPANRPGKKSLKRWILLAALLIFVMSMMWYTPQGNGGIRAVYIFIRTLLIIAVWYLLLAPLLMFLLRRFLNKKQSRYSREVSNALAVIPSLRRLAVLAWKNSAPRRGPARLYAFLSMLIAYSLCFEAPKPDQA